MGCRNQVPIAVAILKYSRQHHRRETIYRCRLISCRTDCSQDPCDPLFKSEDLLDECESRAKPDRMDLVPPRGDRPRCDCRNLSQSYVECPEKNNLPSEAPELRGHGLLEGKNQLVNAEVAAWMHRRRRGAGRTNGARATYIRCDQPCLP